MSYKRTAKKLSEKLSELLNDDIVISSDQVEEFNIVSAGSEEATNIVTPYINSVVKKIGLKSSAAVTEGPCKKITRAFAKAVTKFEGDIKQVPDIGRMRILIEKPEDITALREIFLGKNPEYTDKRLGIIKDQHPKTGITVREFEDFYHVPSGTGRIAIHIGLDIKMSGFKNAIPFEIQVIHKDMEKTEDQTRQNYKKIQLIERRAIMEGRVNSDGSASLSSDEIESIESYNNSSRELYRGDSLRLRLYDLRRPDLAARKNFRLRQLEMVA